jgi:hypothetical protein
MTIWPSDGSEPLTKPQAAVVELRGLLAFVVWLFTGRVADRETKRS